MAVVTNLDPKRRKSTPLDELTGLVSQDLDAVNELILANMHSSVEMIPQLAGYIIAAGGKRLRPVLTLAAAQLCGYKGDCRHQTNRKLLFYYDN